MTHRFNTQVASECGLVEAILIENLHFWTQKNQKTPPVDHMGRQWTYCSVRRFADVLPYLSERQIKDAMKRMTEAGYVYKTKLEGTPNNTNYYALSEAVLALYKTDVKPIKEVQPTEATGDAVFTPEADQPLGTESTNHLVQNVPSEEAALSTESTNHLVQNVLTTWSEKYQPIYDNKKKDGNNNDKKDSCQLFELHPTTPPVKIDFKKWDYNYFAADVNQHAEYPEEMRADFLRYWSEQNQKGKMRFQLGDTWNTKGRLVTWSSKEYNQKPQNTTHVRTNQNRSTPARSHAKSAGASSLLDSLGSEFTQSA